MAADPVEPAPRVFESRFRVRSYELDGLGHVNHAVFLNWFEQARFEALESGGLPVDQIAARGWAVVVARVEVDFHREARHGQRLRIRTRVEEPRNTSLVLRQEAVLDEAGDDEILLAEARVVAVWLRDGRPRRIPPEVREALSLA